MSSKKKGKGSKKTDTPGATGEAEKKLPVTIAIAISRGEIKHDKPGVTKGSDEEATKKKGSAKKEGEEKKEEVAGEGKKEASSGHAVSSDKIKTNIAVIVLQAAVAGAKKWITDKTDPNALLLYFYAHAYAIDSLPAVASAVSTWNLLGSHTSGSPSKIQTLFDHGAMFNSGDRNVNQLKQWRRSYFNTNVARSVHGTDVRCILTFDQYETCLDGLILIFSDVRDRTKDVLEDEDAREQNPQGLVIGNPETFIQMLQNINHAFSNDPTFEHLLTHIKTNPTFTSIFH